VSPNTYDHWLEHYYSDILGELDERCRTEPLDYEWFRDLDDDLWTVLLSREYAVFPNLRRALPGLPPASLQREWNGLSGMDLARQSAHFYGKLKRLYSRWGPVRLSEATVLDFGCGWGRLIRFIARDVAPEALYGCDPYAGILTICKQTRVPGRLRPIPYGTESLPYTDRFDLVFAFSVFTHLSEDAHVAALNAIYETLGGGGILIATVRPPIYARHELHAALRRSSAVRALERDQPAYLFVPHKEQPSGGDVTFGEAVVNLPYVLERWNEQFKLVEVGLLVDDPYQVVLTLRKRSTVPMS
jgi:SAM-dependent methyltransferase